METKKLEVKKLSNKQIANLPEPTRKKMGRPTKYYPGLCEEIVDFFKSEDTYFTRTKSESDRGSSTELFPRRLPTLAGFAIRKNIDIDSIHEWGKRYPDFSDAIRKCKEYQKDFLLQNGMNGLYNNSFTMFVATNFFPELKNKSEVEVHEGEKPLQEMSEDELKKKLEEIRKKKKSLS